MKNSRVWKQVFVGGALAGCLLFLSQGVSAQDNSQRNDGQAVQTEQPAQDSATFVGTIGKTHGDYVLKSGYATRNPDAKTTYKLDDQEKAKEFAGKNVKVSGTLDAATNTIHVTEIKPAS